MELSECKSIGELPVPGNLRTLNINQCTFPRPILDLSKLKMLQHLEITHCEELKVVRGVENMTFLEDITVTGCPSLREFSDLSKFEALVVSADDFTLFEGFRGIIKDPTPDMDSELEDWPDELEESFHGQEEPF